MIWNSSDDLSDSQRIGLDSLDQLRVRRKKKFKQNQTRIDWNQIVQFVWSCSIVQSPSATIFNIESFCLLIVFGNKPWWWINLSPYRSKRITFHSFKLPIGFDAKKKISFVISRFDSIRCARWKWWFSCNDRISSLSVFHHRF